MGEDSKFEIRWERLAQLPLVYKLPSIPSDVPHSPLPPPSDIMTAVGRPPVIVANAKPPVQRKSKGPGPLTHLHPLKPPLLLTLC